MRKLTIYSGRIANGIPVQKGGFGLAQETIDAIRQAEAAAEAAEKDAVKQAEAIVAQMKAEMTKSAREGAMGAEEDAKAQSEQMMQAAGAEEGKDLEALQKAVAEKQQKAVEVILSELL